MSSKIALWSRMMDSVLAKHPSMRSMWHLKSSTTDSGCERCRGFDGGVVLQCSGGDKCKRVCHPECASSEGGFMLRRDGNLVYHCRAHLKTSLYCVCRRPYNEAESMIGCDSCGEWYHMSCVGLLADYDDDSYVCKHCAPILTLSDPLERQRLAIQKQLNEQKDIETSEQQEGTRMTEKLSRLLEIVAPFVDQLSSRSTGRLKGFATMRDIDRPIAAIESVLNFENVDSAQEQLLKNIQPLALEWLEILREAKARYIKWSRRAVSAVESVIESLAPPKVLDANAAVSIGLQLSQQLKLLHSVDAEAMAIRAAVEDVDSLTALLDALGWLAELLEILRSPGKQGFEMAAGLSAIVKAGAPKFKRLSSLQSAAVRSSFPVAPTDLDLKCSQMVPNLQLFAKLGNEIARNVIDRGTQAGGKVAVKSLDPKRISVTSKSLKMDPRSYITSNNACNTCAYICPDLVSSKPGLRTTTPDASRSGSLFQDLLLTPAETLLLDEHNRRAEAVRLLQEEEAATRRFLEQRAGPQSSRSLPAAAIVANKGGSVPLVAGTSLLTEGIRDKQLPVRDQQDVSMMDRSKKSAGATETHDDNDDNEVEDIDDAEVMKGDEDDGFSGEAEEMDEDDENGDEEKDGNHGKLDEGVSFEPTIGSTADKRSQEEPMKLSGQIRKRLRESVESQEDEVVDEESLGVFSGTAGAALTGILMEDQWDPRQATEPKQLSLNSFGLGAGNNQTVVILLTVPPQSVGWAVNLSPPDPRDQFDLLLHFNPRYTKQEIVCNDKQGTWGMAHKVSLNRQKSGLFASSVELAIQVIPEGFCIFANGAYAAFFAHRRNPAGLASLTLSLPHADDMGKNFDAIVNKVWWGYREPALDKIPKKDLSRVQELALSVISNPVAPRTLEIQGLPKQDSSTELYEIEKALGNLFDVEDMAPPEAVSIVPKKGIGYVRMQNEEFCVEAIRRWNLKAQIADPNSGLICTLSLLRVYM